MVSRCVYFKDSDQLLVVSSAATIHYTMLASELTPVVTERYLLSLFCTNINVAPKIQGFPTKLTALERKMALFMI